MLYVCSSSSNCSSISISIRIVVCSSTVLVVLVVVRNDDDGVICVHVY
jgi:hypothetical protein